MSVYSELTWNLPLSVETEEAPDICQDNQYSVRDSNLVCINLAINVWC